MKKILTLLCLFALAPTAALAKVAVVHGNVPVSGLDVTRAKQKIMLSMNLDVTDFRLGKDLQITLTPVIHNSDSTLSHEFRPIYIAGRNLYYKHLRDGDLESATLLYRSGSADTLFYTADMPEADWVRNSMLSVRYRVGGCCNATIEEGVDRIIPIMDPVEPTFMAMFNYVSPVADGPKTREITARANVDFVVDRYNIKEDYHDNARELRKIQASIDSVRLDKDITIDSIVLKGFASPEATYKHNTFLAVNRTKAIKDYLDRLMHLDHKVITTDYDPEDWDGLRRYVAKSNLEHRDQILAIIDSDMAPDPKEAKIKKLYPAEYKFMKEHWYPYLRHTDYRIKYTIRTYNTLEEILRILDTAPQKLSLSEFYRAAQSMEPGSPEYNNVLETAVRFYPTSNVANLNAANAAMSRADFNTAEFYLNRAGDGPEAVYARGILAALRQDYPKAKEYFEEAARMKVADAPAAIEQVDSILQWKKEQANPNHPKEYISIN